MELVRDNGLTERHARALLRLHNDEQRELAIQKIVRGGFNVERTESMIEQLLGEEKERSSLKKRSVIFGGDVRLFLNTINRAVETMQAAGIDAIAEKKKNEEYIEYTIIIPYGR